MNKKSLNAGDIVQLDPFKTKNKSFRGCFLVVTEVKDWGVEGYVPSLGENLQEAKGLAYYRAENGTFEPTGGKAHWVAY